MLSVSTAAAENIKVLEAVYGTPEAQRTCSATRAVARICDGKPSCAVPVDNELCGDPNGGVVKSLAIKYGCGTAAGDAASDACRDGHAEIASHGLGPCPQTLQRLSGEVSP